ncbi:MAG: response regulator transcription factor [Clostridiales bacterium]|nr:response regulator transcription factor [Clostridiales bacterium]
MRILIAEDEQYLNRILTRQLEKAGYGVDACLDGLHALDYLMGTAVYDAVILDIMMPGMDGLTVLSRIRQAGIDAPVLLLTARDGIEDRVKGLDAGADDYLVKPFAAEELLARLRALLRRGSGKRESLLTVGDLTLDPAARRVSRAGQIIALSAREYSILEYLMRNAGAVLSREQIEDHIWNYDYQGGSNVVDVYIRYLRGKIDAPFEKKLIHTVRNAGYVLREEP